MCFSCLQCVPCVLNSPSFLSSLYFLNISADHSSFEQQFLCGTYFTYNLLISPVLCEIILNTCIALSLLFARKEIVQHVLRYRRLDIKQRFWIFQLLLANILLTFWQTSFAILVHLRILASSHFQQKFLCRSYFW